MIRDVRLSGKAYVAPDTASDKWLLLRFRFVRRVRRVRDGALLRLHLSPLLDMSKVVRDTIADTPIETVSKSV
jgi:hypothetical protein